MLPVSRRTFLGASAAGLVAAPLWAKDEKQEKKEKKISFAQQLAEATPDRPTNLFATWQRDPTTTMTIQWIAGDDAKVDTRIHVRAKDAAKGEKWKTLPTTTRAYPLSELTQYRLELSDLKPGTDYEFRIGERSKVYRFATMPAKATDALTFVSGGDCGVNDHTIANNIRAAHQDPAFAIIGGDLAYDNGSAIDTNLKFLHNYSQHMLGRNGRLIPMLACLGNHEVQGGYSDSRDKAPFFYALFDGLFSETGYAALDFGDYLSLLLLDTGHTSKIGGEQTDWLEKRLAERIDHPHALVVNHVPAYPSHRPMFDAKGNPATGAENRKHWVPLFEKYRVPVVLEHHDHTFKRSKTLLNELQDDNGVLYLGDGSWGMLRAALKPEKLPHLALTSEDYHLTVHRIEGEERFHMAMNEVGRVMDVSHSAQRLKGLVAAGG